jgi:hypothetical protein
MFLHNEEFCLELGALVINACSFNVITDYRNMQSMLGEASTHGSTAFFHLTVYAFTSCLEIWYRVRT